VEGVCGGLGVREHLSENSLTPSVSVPFIQSISSARSNFMSNIESARNSLRQLGFATTSVEVGEMEVGFLVPREIFKNTLDGFIKEANVIKFILDTANLTATGAASEITVEQLSTSDPYLIFGLDPTAAVMLAGVITWGLNTWKQTLEIRELKAKAREIPTLKDIADQFEIRIKEVVADPPPYHTAPPASRCHDENGHSRGCPTNPCFTGLIQQYRTCSA
jgi:hypothetical protein